MLRKSYLDTLDIFGHIDGEFVSCNIGFPGREAVFQVRFYPWWQHPGYIKARQEGTAWAFHDLSAAQQIVTVFAHNVVECSLHYSELLEECYFSGDDPRLWKLAPRYGLFCNAPLSEEDVEQIYGRLREKLKPWQSEVLTYLGCPDTLRKRGQHSSFSLGHFPPTVWTALAETLDDLHIPRFPLGPLKAHPETEPRTLFVAGGSYIIAEDFEVAMPEWEHRPGWLR